jgi:two-component system, sensor histidine kinase LadS
MEVSAGYSVNPYGTRSLMACTSPSIARTCTRLAAWLQLYCLVCGLFMLTGHAWSQSTQAPTATQDELILQSAYWEDAGTQVSFDTARQQRYTPYTGIFNRGYTDSVHWIRLTLAASPQPLGLRITPVWLNSITLYDPLNPETPVTVGDRHPTRHNALPGLGHSFELPPSPAPRQIWLRLQTTSSHFLNVKAMPIDQAAQAGTRQIIWSALYAAILLLILFVLLAIWWMQRDRVLGTYLLRHAVYTYYGAAYLGLPTLLLSDWLPPTFFDRAFSISATILLPLGVWFDAIFLSGYRPQKHLLILLKAVGMISLGVVLAVLLGHTRLALQINAFMLMLAVVLMALTALSCQSDPSTEQIMPKKVMVTYYSLILSSLLVGLVNMLGWIQVQEWTVYALILHGLVSGLMMAAILIVRAQRMAKLNQEMGWQLQKAAQDMALEQRRRHEQSQFLHMLMHELKNPMQVVSLALGTKKNREENLEYAGQAVQDMKAIIDRCVHADQMGELTIQRSEKSVDLAAMISQLGQHIPFLQQRLQVHAPEDLPNIYTDQQLVQIILNNLLDNATRYSDPITLVTVCLALASRQGHPGLTVRVSNTPGLASWPDEQLLFTKYYRARGAQRESGSGLGLYLARQLAHSLGGSLAYTPSSQYVEFVLWIPLSPV